MRNMLLRSFARIFIGSAVVSFVGILLLQPVLFQTQDQISSGISSSTSGLVVTTKKTVRGTNANGGRPPLSSLIGDVEANITGDVQFLLDFAIIGHSKTATSCLQEWFANHKEVQMYNHEIHSLKNKKPAELVKYMYELPAGSQYKRGYKAPNDIRRPHSLEALRTYWPKTKLIVGVRHPIQWFQSYYNFVRLHSRSLPPAETMVGDSLPDQVRFHEHLAMLGKTDLSDSAEMKLLGPHFDDNSKLKQPLPNEVFLYDISQPSDTDVPRNERFRKDLSRFLGLHQTLDKVDPRESPVPETVPDDYVEIDICDKAYDQVRADLLQLGIAASTWIKDYFLDHPDVTVSSPNHFKEILDTWHKDPCEDSKAGNKNKLARISGGKERKQDDPNPVNIDDRPPLSSLIGDLEANVTGDVQFLLDFAIVGHPKTATSSFTRWLSHSGEVQIKIGEVHSLTQNKPAELVKYLYDLPAGKQYKRGYKAPQHICMPHALKLIATYWPKTKLIVGLRHPVKWFESFYNYNSRRANLTHTKLEPAETYFGEKIPDRVRHHVHLSFLGKTNPSDPAEAELLGPTYKKPYGLDSMSNEVFLYDVSQPFDHNESRNERFRKDLSAYIGLQRTLDPLPARTSPKGNYHYAIDICDQTYDEVRADLIQLGTAASTWIKNYFLEHPDVTVSSPEHFKDILDSWHEDPCDTKAGIDQANVNEKKVDEQAKENRNIPKGSKVSNQAEMDNRPPLSSLLEDVSSNVTNITGDVQFLLDFAIVGHPKTATSSMMRWFASHDEILIYTNEIRCLKNDRPAELVKLMYDLPAGSQYKRGYKDPRDICNPRSLRSFGKYWPKTKLIVGLRHPVKWFESWYNFKVRKGYSFPPAEEIAKKVRGDLPDQVNYHIHLATLGKTNALKDVNQLKLLGNATFRLRMVPPLPNEVFLFEVSQPYDRDLSRRELFRQDLSNFIGLRRPLDPPEIRNSSASPNHHYVLDICEEAYNGLRADLMRVSVSASTWIREYFLEHPDVTVSSPDHFKDILMTWMQDPCEATDTKL